MISECPKSPGVTALCVFKTGFVAWLLSLACASCVPLPNRTVTNIIAQRTNVNGTPFERLEQEIVFHRTLYLIGPDGPFVTVEWPKKKFNYRLVDPQEGRQELPFFAKKDVQWDYLIAFPISDERWIAIASPETHRHVGQFSEDLEEVRRGFFNS